MKSASLLFGPAQRSLFGVIAVVMAFSIGGCSGEITDEDLKMWTNNEEGFRQMERIMTDPEVTQETRVKGLHYLAKANQAPQVSRILYATPKPTALAQGLRDKLLPEMTSESPDAVSAKDALFAVASHLPEAEKSDVLKAIAAWSFEGLSKDSPTEKIKKQTEHRIGINGVERLGKHGVPGAALLISRGFAVSTLFDYVASEKGPEHNDLILDALVAYEALPEISVTRNQLSRYTGLGTARAGAHLMSLYLSLGKEDEDLSLDSFNGAQEIFSKKENRKDPAIISKSVRPLLEAKNPDDRWYAATLLLELEKEAVLDECFAALKDDNVYAKGMIDPLKSMVDFCRDGVAPLGETGQKKVKSMVTKGNRVQRTVGMICMKAMEMEFGGKKAYKKFSKSKENLNSLLGNKMTVPRLAENVRDGVAYLKKLKADAGDDKKKLEAYESKKFFVVVTAEKVGDALIAEVEARHESSQAKDGQ